jgi:hypothetical protein
MRALLAATVLLSLSHASLSSSAARPLAPAPRFHQRMPCSAAGSAGALSPSGSAGRSTSATHDVSFCPPPSSPICSPRLARLRGGRKEAGAPAVVGFQNHVFKVWGSRLGVGGLGGWGSGFQNLRFRGLGLGLRVTGLWLQVEGSILPRRV